MKGIAQWELYEDNCMACRTVFGVLHRVCSFAVCGHAFAAKPCHAVEPAAAPATAALATAVAAPAPNEKVELRLRLKEGQAYGLRSISEQKITQTANGQKVTSRKLSVSICATMC
jgi:hypothetical protein